MEERNILGFGGGGGTSLEPLTLLLLLSSLVAVFVCSRRRVLGFLLVVCLLVPIGQRLEILGTAFSVLRMLTLAALVRLGFEGSLRHTKWCAVDKRLAVWCFSAIITYLLLWLEPGAVINRAGFLIDTLGFYLVLRMLFSSEEDVDFGIKCICIVATVVAVGMFFEQVRGVNLFSSLGAQEMPVEREGRTRSQGPFPHALLAGHFGASCLPLCFWGWFKKTSSVGKWAPVGMVSCFSIVACSMSSTPLIVALSGALGMALWRWRESLPLFRRLAVCGVIGLHLVMKAPVWALIGRVDVVGGSTGYHRVSLINSFLGHWEEWVLLGTKSTSDWGHVMWDITNEYINQGVRGGLITLVIFLLLLASAFNVVGGCVKRATQEGMSVRHIWCLGVALACNCVGFFGITLWGQASTTLYALLAMIAYYGSSDETTRELCMPATNAGG